MLRDLLKVTKGDITFLLQKNDNIFTRFYLGNPYACKTLGTYLAWQLRSQASMKSKQASGVFSWNKLHSEDSCCLPQNRVTRFCITIRVSKKWWVRHNGNGACSYFPLLEWDFCCSQNGKAKHSLDISLFEFAALTSDRKTYNWTVRVCQKRAQNKGLSRCLFRAANIHDRILKTINWNTRISYLSMEILKWTLGITNPIKVC